MEQKNLIERLSCENFNKDGSVLKKIILSGYLTMVVIGLVFWIDSLTRDAFLSIIGIFVLGTMLVLAYIIIEPFLFKKEYKESVKKALQHKFQIGNKVGYKNGYHFKESCIEFTIKNYDDEAEVFLLSGKDNKLKEVKLDTFLHNYISLED